MADLTSEFDLVMMAAFDATIEPLTAIHWLIFKGQ
jgi:hypothetical protein